MKIGRINRLAKAGEMVSVRLPDGKTISAKAGNDLNSTTVVISKTQSGWFAFSSQGEIKAVSTQVINRRPRQATPEIYPIKVLFSVEFDDKFEFYIGGDRNIPIKIWELEIISNFNQEITIVKSASINSTGNKPDDWIVMIQFSSPDLIFNVSGQTIDDLVDLEASVILQPNLSPIIYVGANGCNPVGNGFFAPRDPYIWYFFDDTRDGDDFLITEENYRPYMYTNSLKGIVLSSSGSTDELAANRDLMALRPWLYNDEFQGFTTNSLAELWLYEPQFDWTFNTLGPRIGVTSVFAYLDPIYYPIKFTPFNPTVFVSNLYVPSVNANNSLFPLYWDEVEFLSPSAVTALLNVFCPNFHNLVMSEGLTIEGTSLVNANFIAENYSLASADQAFDVELLRSLNIVITDDPPYSYPNNPTGINIAKTLVFRDSRDIYDYKRIYTETKAQLISRGDFAAADTEYYFAATSTISSGTFHYVIVSPSGIERTFIPYDLRTIRYKRDYDSRAMSGYSQETMLTKVSAFGNMEMMGVTFDVDVRKTILVISANDLFIDREGVYSGRGEAIKQKGLDNSAIIHRIDYELSFAIAPSFLEESFYYKDGFKYPLTTTNQDFRVVIINYSGLRIVPLFNAEDILENNRISRVAWSQQDGDDLKERNIKLNVKTYRIIVDEGTATIPDSSKIKTFKVKNLSPILSQLDPVVADTAIVHSMSCYFN
jgi:hypothetical protein